MVDAGTRFVIAFGSGLAFHLLDWAQRKAEQEEKGRFHAVDEFKLALACTRNAIGAVILVGLAPLVLEFNPGVWGSVAAGAVGDKGWKLIESMAGTKYLK